MSVISIEGITKLYGSQVAVDELSLSLDAGEILGFLGPNGSGKTTTIRVLLGFLRASHGKARILDMDVWEDRHRIHERVGYISGDFRMYRWMTLRSALVIVGKVRKSSILEKGLELGELLDLDPSVPVKSMSRGMRQKLGLILALAHEPSVLILDEPTTALDPSMKKIFFDYVRERAALGCTVFFSSHSLSEVEDLCDSVAFVRSGRLVERESLDSLRKRALKHVMVKYKNGAKDASNRVPDFVEQVENMDDGWEGVLTGNVQDFLKWSVEQEYSDVIISPPDLDRLFHAYYVSGESTE